MFNRPTDVAKEATPTPPSSKAAAPEPKLFPDEINIKQACEIAGLSMQRFRSLVVEGKVPSKKNSKGYHKFSRKAVEEWANSREKHSRTSDGKKTVKVRVDATQEEALRKMGLDPKAAYTNKAKAKA